MTTGGTTTTQRYPVTWRIIGAYHAVYHHFGWGFLEAVYRRGMISELRHAGADVAAEVRFPIVYRGDKLGEYVADLVVDDSVIVECKVAERIATPHRSQLINYLKATRYETGLILNFGPRPAFERIVFTQARKAEHLFRSR